MSTVVNRCRLWDKIGGIKISDMQRRFNNMLRFQVPLPGGINLLLCGLVAGWRAVAHGECSQVLICF